MRVLTEVRNLSAAAALPYVAPVGALAVVVIWSARDGGFPTTSWYPGGIVIGALLAVQILGGAMSLPPFAARVTVASLAAYALFELASIAWSSSKGSAWDSANRTFAYAFVLALFAGTPMSRGAKGVLVCALAVALAAVAVVTLFSAAASPASAFLFDRLSPPTGYANATAALFLIPFWAAVGLAGDPHRPPWLRAPALGSAAVLVAVALVPESRGAVYAAPIAAVLLLALTPYRYRTSLALAVAVAPTAILVHTFTRPYADPALHARSHATREAAFAAIVVGVVVAAVGFALALADRRFAPQPSPRLRLVRVVLAVAVVAAVVAAAIRYDPRHVADRAWASFRAPTQSGGVGGTRLLGNLGSNRYDFWRVALDVAKDHPVGGVGADNFSEAYLVRRRSQEQPLYPHSLEMGVLAQTGAIGAILFACFLGFGAAAVARARRRDPAWAGIAAGCATAFGYWIVHGSVDWLWEFPALAGCALSLLGLAVSDGARARVPRAGALAATAVAVALALSFVPPWLSARQTERAAADWQGDPAFAYSLLDQAASLDPLSDTPAVTKMTIAAQVGDARTMAASARDAIARDSHNWYSRLQLALALAHAREWDAAAAEVRAAHRLDPGEPLVGDIATAVRRRHAAPLDTINLAVLGDIRTLDPRLRPGPKAR